MTSSEPSTVRKLLCLANSRKLSGRCIAGKEVLPAGPGPWIRPVSARPQEEVSENERQYEDGSDPRVMDIIEVPLLRRVPKAYQPENWLLDPTQYWSKAGSMGPATLDAWIDDPDTLWTNGDSTAQGSNDRVPLQQAAGVAGSLYLLRIVDLRLVVFAPGKAFGNPRRRVQARFTHRGIPYGLWVTDPKVAGAYLARPDAEYTLGRSYLTVSLGEPLDGYCYKLVAAVIGPEGGLP